MENACEHLVDAGSFGNRLEHNNVFIGRGKAKVVWEGKACNKLLGRAAVLQMQSVAGENVRVDDSASLGKGVWI
eukprot:3531791-Alexandrium_andersonii.AAC.1